MDEETLRIAKALVARTLAKDVDGVMELYAEDAIAWRNVDGRELGKPKIRKVIEFLATKVEGLTYEDVRIEPTQGGFVQQHTLRGKTLGGEPFASHACIVARVGDGLLCRVDEYFDPAAMAPLFR